MENISHIHRLDSSSAPAITGAEKIYALYRSANLISKRPC